MSADNKAGISLSINKAATQRCVAVASVFGDDSDEGEPQTSAQRFDFKYGGSRAQHQRAVAKVLADNPEAYEYDSVHDKIEKKREKLRGVDAKADADRSSKYMDRFMNAKKKRELERLLRDERKQEKERVEEGDEFKDKEVFITGAYRKQLEDTVKFREQLEASDRADDKTRVSTHDYRQKLEETVIHRQRIKEESESDEDANQESSPAPRPQADALDKFQPKLESERADESSRMVTRVSDKRKEESIPPRQPIKEEPVRSLRQIEREERQRRMDKVREILARHNTDDDIAATRERYLERRRQGLIVH